MILNCMDRSSNLAGVTCGSFILEVVDLRVIEVLSGNS